MFSEENKADFMRAFMGLPPKEEEKIEEPQPDQVGEVKAPVKAKV